MAKAVSASLSKMTFTRPEEFFEQNNFLKTLYKSDLFLNFSRKRLAGWSNCLHVSSGTVLKSWTPWEKSKFFVVPTHYMKLFRNFKRNWQGCQVSIHHLQCNISRKKVDWMKQFSDFHHALTSSKKPWVELSHLLPRRRGEGSDRGNTSEL